jgi:phosphatidylserine/phosphatidylglycerophosphate/cardiolipin synthase-like enzyme
MILPAARSISGDAEGTAPRVVMGSMNWSTAGDERNDENTLIV